MEPLKVFKLIIIFFLVVAGCSYEGDDMAGLNSNTKLLIHCDGSDESTSFTDKSESNHSITADGTAQKDTASKKWGTASLLLDGDSDFLVLADSPDWDICGSSTDNWTIDFWVKHDDHNAVERYISHWEDSDNYWVLYHVHLSGLRFILHSGGTTVIDTSYRTEITDSNWHHVALCKVGSEYAVYLDGEQTNYVDDSSTDTFTGKLYIGKYGYAAFPQYFDGHMDELRIQNSNYFNASPQADDSDTIDVPIEAYSLTGILPLFRPNRS